MNPPRHAKVQDEEMDRCERLLTDCHCHADYKDRGRTDPNCMACQLGSEVIDTFREMRNALRAPPNADTLVSQPKGQPARPQNGVPVRLGRELFRFDSFPEWVNKAQSRFATYAAGIPSAQYVCIDATGRICTIGKHFMSARDRNAFPVIVYLIEPESKAPTAAGQGAT